MFRIAKNNNNGNAPKSCNRRGKDNEEDNRWFGCGHTPCIHGGSICARQDKGLLPYVGSKTDGGWTQAHDLGRQELEKALGDKIETQFVENVPEGPDAERALERFARSDCKLIFTTSFGFMDPTVKIAEKFPDVKFEHATGYKSGPNLATYNSRFYEGRYIQGKIAGKMSTKGVAGYIASFPIPEVVQGINSFLLGAQSVNPDFKLKSSGSTLGLMRARKLMRPRL